MKTSTYVLSCAVLLLSAAPLFASNGSIYSRFGIGDIITPMSSRTDAMGGAGIALLTDGYINRSNPAALGRITRTQYAADFQYQGYAMNDGTTSSFLSAGNFGGASLAFPVYGEYSMVFAFGISPFSHSGYDVRVQETALDQSVEQRFDGSGGTSSAQFSLSFSPRQDLYFGATVHYLFGKFDDRQRYQFVGTSFFESDVDQETSMDGFAFTFGSVYAGVDKALGLSSEKNLNLAATFFTGSNLNASQQSLNTYITSTETTAVREGTVKIPLGITIGAAYLVQDRVILTGDVQMEQWNDFRYFDARTAGIRNSIRAGVGAEILPSHVAGESYYREISYRGGAYVNSSYLKVSGTPINEYGLTAGLGLPIFIAPSSEARGNISISYGIRGTTSNGLQQDHILRLTLSLSGSDTWFLPPEVE